MKHRFGDAAWKSAQGTARLVRKVLKQEKPATVQRAREDVQVRLANLRRMAAVASTGKAEMAAIKKRLGLLEQLHAEVEG